jgi:hypothetical protein
MTLYSAEVQRFGLAKESVRGTAETAPTKWYPSRGRVEMEYKRTHIEDKGLRGIQAQMPPVKGPNKGDGKIPLYLDSQMICEFLYSLLGGLSSAEQTVITIAATNKFLDFNIGSTELTATVAEASYKIGTAETEAGTLCKAIYDAIVAAEAVGVYTVRYSRTTKKFTIARSTGTFEIMLKTGTHGSDNLDTHIGTILGYADTADLTGAVSYAGTVSVEYAFKHTFTNSGISKPSYTYFVDRSLNIMAYALVVAKKLSLKSTHDNMVEPELEVLFKNEATGSIGSPSFPTQKYLGFNHVDFKIAGASSTDVKEWDLTIDNGAKPYGTLALSEDISDIVAPDPMKISGSFLIYFTSATERAKFLANTSVALRMLVAGETISGTFKHSVDINIYDARYKAFPYGEDIGLLAAKASFEGYYSVSDSKEIQIDVINQEASY